MSNVNDTLRKVLALMDESNDFALQAANLRVQAADELRQFIVSEMARRHHQEIVEDWHGKAGRRD